MTQNEIVFEIVLLVVGAILGAILLPLWNRWQAERSHRGERRFFWGGSDRDRFVILYRAYEDPDSPPSKKNYNVKSQTVRALFQLEEKLEELGFSVSHKAIHEGITESDKKANVILLGSSKANHAVSMFPEVEKYFRIMYDKNSGHGYIKGNGLTVESHLLNTDEQDVAIIIKVPNRYCTDRFVYYIAGAHADGTYGAARLSVDTREFLSQWKKAGAYNPLFGRLKQDQGCALILSIHFGEDILSDVIRYEAQAWKPLTFDMQ